MLWGLAASRKRNEMETRDAIQKLALIALVVSSLFPAGRASAADIKGQVMGGGAPSGQSTVTLWAASASAPQQLAQTKTNEDGKFAIHGAAAPNASLYLVATGGEPKSGGGNNPAIALLTVLGGKPPAIVVINEFTTIASV